MTHQPTPRAAFPQVEEGAATGDLAAAYVDMRAALRVPWVMFAARALASFGDFVPAAWDQAKGVFETYGLEDAADLIRSAAVMEDPPPVDLAAALAAEGVDDADIRAVREAVRTLHYGNSKYLLLITAWSEGIQGRSSGGTEPDPSWDGRRLPSGPPPGMADLELIDPLRAGPEVLRLLDTVVDRHLHHGPASDFRVLARWPDAFAVADREVLAPVVRTEKYDAAARRLLHQARELVAGFPQAAGLDPVRAGEVTTDIERAAIVAMLSMFQRFILDVTLDLARLSQSLEGTDAARRNPFPPG